MFDLQKNECPVQIHADSLDPIATEQVKQIARHPAIHGLISIMPDAHAGAGCVIGFTGKFRQSVIPNIVGVDIGCGVAAFPLTGVVKIDFQGLDDYIRASIPLGMNQREDAAFFKSVPVPDTLKKVAHSLCEHTEEGFYKANKIGKHLSPLIQLGTLGGGNHFIEIGVDEEGTSWIVLHSGSRKVGHSVAEHYMKIAANSDRPLEGCYGIDANSKDGKDYITDLKFCLEFALANRKEMAHRIEQVIAKYAKCEADFSKLINRNHNHAELKDGLWIHRKGATHAEKDMMGVIPGNMRDGSFIV